MLFARPTLPVPGRNLEFSIFSFSLRTITNEPYENFIPRQNRITIADFNETLLLYLFYFFCLVSVELFYLVDCIR